MSRPKNRREQRLLILLPAALILAIYSFFVAIPQQRKLQATVDELDSLRRTAVTAEEANESQNLLQMAQNNLESERQRIAAGRNKLREVALSWRADDSQLESVQQITKAMEEFNLSVVNQDNESQPILSDYFVDICQIINTHCEEQPLRFWQVEVEGRYFDLTNFLASIDHQVMRTIPVSISMVASTNNDGNHSWKIVFMI